MTTPDVAVVMGTVNRLRLLQACVESIRRAVGKLSYICLVADGNSTDGSREWLAAQPDCELLEGGLDGAVKAYNVAFARAVDLNSPFVCQFNDDANFLSGPPQIEGAAEFLRVHPPVGSVNFALDRYGKWEHLRYHGVCYGNYLLTRREVGMAVARALGDPTGKAWWDRQFHSYAADTVMGCWTWRLGWSIYEANEWRVHDPYTTDGGHNDSLRKHNVSLYTNGSVFIRQWGSPQSIKYNRADAERFGGVLR